MAARHLVGAEYAFRGHHQGVFSSSRVNHNGGIETVSRGTCCVGSGCTGVIAMPW